jgi:hypothetical protein
MKKETDDYDSQEEEMKITLKEQKEEKQLKRSKSKMKKSDSDDEEEEGSDEVRLHPAKKLSVCSLATFCSSASCFQDLFSLFVEP